MNDDPWAQGLSTEPTQPLPPPPNAMPETGSLPPSPAPADSSPSKLAKVGGAIIMVLGALVVIGSLADLDNPEYASAKAGLFAGVFLSAASAVGGFYIFRHGWRQRRTLANVLSILPASVTVTLVVVGALISATQHHAPTDAYGYTAGDRQLFVAVCEEGAESDGTCDCLFSELEKQFTPAELNQLGIDYEQTGEYSPEFVEAIQNSSCI